MRKCAIISLLALASVFAVAKAPSTPTQALVENLAADYPFRTGLLGVMAVTASGDTLVNFNGYTSMVPASNVKVVTCALAMSTLGSDYRFQTHLAYSGTIKDGVLTGNVYIIGGGDPTTVAKSEQADSLFGTWTEMLRKAGITKIDGAIIGDGDYIRRDGGHESWSIYDRCHSYGATPSGLNYFENTQTFIMTPSKEDEGKVSYSVKYPETPWMEFRNNCRTTSSKKAGGISYFNTYLAHVAEFSGCCYSGRGKFAITASNCFPELTCSYHFYKYLNSNGIPVAEYTEGSSRGIALRDLGTTYSDSLKHIIRQTLYESDNFYAETLFRMLGKKRLSSTCLDSCRVAVRNGLASMSVSTSLRPNIVDGSGLSRKNFASPAFFVSLLRSIRNCNWADDFFACLPYPGHGTLKKRLAGADSSVKSRIHMKSGSMNATLCFSGYIMPSDGNPADIICFSILTNNIGASGNGTSAGIEKILMSLTSEK